MEDQVADHTAVEVAVVTEVAVAVEDMGVTAVHMGAAAHTE